MRRFRGKYFLSHSWRVLNSLLGVLLFFPEVQAAEPPLPLLLEESFEQGLDRWEFTDSQVWTVADSKAGKVLRQTAQSKYQPPFRSPLNIALLKENPVGDFHLEADLLSTVKDYGHRDLCLFFGYQDSAHFYYVHLGKKADDHANQIFIVNGAARTKISTTTTPGTNWDDNWHHVKIVRRTESGTIEVYFDDMKKPIMTAQDKTFDRGRVGVGSFDDTGDWDNVVLRGEKAAKP